MTKANILITFLCCCWFSGKCSETQFFTKYFKFKFDGKTQLFCGDYSLEAKKYGVETIVLNIESVGSSFILPQGVIVWFSKIIIWKPRKLFEFDTIDFSRQELEHYIWEMDFNADGVEDIGFYDWEASGNHNAMYDVYLKLSGQLKRWHDAPNPFWGSELKKRIVKGGWSNGGGSLYGDTFTVSGDTTLHLIRSWHSHRFWVNSTARIFRKDSILVKGIWEIKIDSNYTEDK